MKHRARSFSGPRLAWRQFAADPWVSAGLAVLIALVALLLTAIPRAFTEVQSRQLVQEVNALSSGQRDLSGQWNTVIHDYVVLDGQDSPWDPIIAGAERIRTDQPEPLSDILQPAHLEARINRTETYPPPVETGYYSTSVTMAADPHLRDHVELVTGDWPELVVPGPTGYSEAGMPLFTPAGDVPVVVLHEAAQEMQWEIGDNPSPSTLLVGTYRPIDPEDPRWQRIENGATMGLLFDPNRGYATVITAYLSPLNPGHIGAPYPVTYHLWYPVDPSAVIGSTSQLSLLRSQLTNVLAQTHVLATAEEVPGSHQDQRPILATELPATIDEVITQQRSTASLVAVIVAGPLGVALAVITLGARLLLHRRGPALTLALARGAAPQQLRWLISGEALALALPAALAGHLIAMALIPGPTPWWQWLVSLVVASVPSVTLAASLDDTSLITRRSDLSGRSGSRWRWVAELAVVLLAALSTWRLLGRERSAADEAEAGIDLLATATPVLLALAACVIALRIYPWPLTALTAALKRGRSLTSFLGSARALRDPAGGLVPALAVVLGTAIALSSTVLLGTVTRGAEVASWQATGAQVRLVGPGLTDDLRAALEEVEGVDAVAGVRESSGQAALTVDGERQQIRLLIADSALEQVYGQAPLAQGPPPAFFEEAERPRVMVGPGVDLPAEALSVSVSGLGQVEVLGELPEVPGLSMPSHFVLVDRAVWESAGHATPSGSTTLMSVQPGADRLQVAQAVEELVASGVVQTPDARLEQFTQAPVADGLRAAFVGAAVVTGAFTVLAIVIVQLMGASARMRVLSVLRTLGMPPAQTRALTSWELGPLVVVSLVVGAVLGLVIPWVLLAALDLRGLTGGLVNPALHLDPVVIGAVLGVVLLTVALAVSVSAWLAGRTNLAQALRVGEER